MPVTHVAVEPPPRPKLEPCPEWPGVKGQVFSKPGEKQLYVEMTLEDAQALQQYRMLLEVCNKVNALILNNHIEKLENRLRAVQ